MARPARVSPDRILLAAAAEFAARGYAGARVDRIARRARVNKAMLYYHFGSKQALYRTLLRRTFAEAGARLAAVADGDEPPDAQIDLLIAGVAAFIRDHEYFPAIMLRELAEGGAHLDRDTLAALASVPRAVAAIVERGVARKAFRPVHPLVAHFSIVAPIAVFLAGAPIRRELAERQLMAGAALTPEAFVQQMQQMLRGALGAEGRDKE